MYAKLWNWDADEILDAYSGPKMRSNEHIQPSGGAV